MRTPRFRPEADREGYVDDRASQGAGRTIVRDFDDEPDDEDYASLDDMFVQAYGRMKHAAGLPPHARIGAEPHDLPGQLRGAIDHEPMSLTRRVPRPGVTDDELVAAAKDLYDRRMALHARYRNPNKIRGDVQGFIARARARRGLRTESVAALPAHRGVGRRHLTNQRRGASRLPASVMLMRADELIQAVLNENRLPALKRKWANLNTDHDDRWEMDEIPQKHRRGAAFDVVTKDMDPSDNMQYSDRLLHFYHHGQIVADDADEVRKTIRMFHDHKHLMPEKDINRYDSFDALSNAVKDVARKANAKKKFPWVKTTAAQRADAEAGSKVIHDSPGYAVREIHTHAAMKVLGSNTKWCTVGRPDLFQKYTSEGPLYHLHDKVNGDRFMAHFPTKQIHNEYGEVVDPEEFTDAHPELDKVFKGRLRTINHEG